jgi:hypothetical protein
VPGDERRRCRLLADDVDDVLTIEGSGMAKEGLLGVVVVGAVCTPKILRPCKEVFETPYPALIPFGKSVSTTFAF